MAGHGSGGGGREHQSNGGGWTHYDLLFKAQEGDCRPRACMDNWLAILHVCSPNGCRQGHIVESSPCVKVHFGGWTPGPSKVVGRSWCRMMTAQRPSPRWPCYHLYLTKDWLPHWCSPSVAMGSVGWARGQGPLCL